MYFAFICITIIVLTRVFLFFHTHPNHRMIPIVERQLNSSSRAHNASVLKMGLEPNPRENTFRQCLERVSRVSGVRANVTGPNVIVTALNYGFRDFIPGWICNANRSGWFFLIIALDRKLYAYMQSHFPEESFCLYTENESVDLSPASDYRRPVYNKVTCIKIDVVLFLLRAKYSVFFMDVDIRWTSDVWLGVKDSPCDYTFQIDNGQYRNEYMGFDIKTDGNTGVYYAKSTRSVIRLFEQVSEHRCDSISSQAIFWNVMRRKDRLGELVYFPEFVKADLGSNSAHPAHMANVSDRKLSFCPLHPIQFAAGWVFKVSRDFRNTQDVRLVHANWMVGKARKMNALKGEGYEDCIGV